MNEITTQTPNKPKASALAVMAERCSVEPAKLHSTLKNTVFKGANDDELLALVVVSNTYELNPLLKEIYAFPKKGGGIVPVVGIDGYLSLINRQPKYDGMEINITPDGEEATCKIYIKDRAHPVIVTEYLSECKRNTEPWKQFPKRMLRHKAIIQAARIAFGFSGIQDEDEAHDTIRNVTPSNDKPSHAAADRLPPLEESAPAVEVETTTEAPQQSPPTNQPETATQSIF